jgi:hypothetical protein
MTVPVQATEPANSERTFSVVVAVASMSAPMLIVVVADVSLNDIKHLLNRTLLKYV